MHFTMNFIQSLHYLVRKRRLHVKNGLRRSPGSHWKAVSVVIEAYPASFS